MSCPFPYNRPRYTESGVSRHGSSHRQPLRLPGFSARRCARRACKSAPGTLAKTAISALLLAARPYERNLQSCQCRENVFFILVEHDENNSFSLHSARCCLSIGAPNAWTRNLTLPRQGLPQNATSNDAHCGGHNDSDADCGGVAIPPAATVCCLCHCESGSRRICTDYNSPIDCSACPEPTSQQVA